MFSIKGASFNMSNFINLLGLIAGILTTIAFVPQVFKTWKTKSTKDISLGMFISFSIGVFLWLIYGICLKATPIVVANILVLILSAMMIYLKIKYK